MNPAEVEQHEARDQTGSNHQFARSVTVKNAPEHRQGKSTEHRPHTVGGAELHARESELLDQDVREDAETHRLSGNRENDPDRGHDDDHPTVEKRPPRGRDGKIRRPMRTAA